MKKNYVDSFKNSFFERECKIVAEKLIAVVNLSPNRWKICVMCYHSFGEL